MTAALLSEVSAGADDHSVVPRAVLCGSFRRNRDELRRTYEALSGVASILSPSSVEFTGDWDGFVYTEVEASSSPREIEDKHLASLSQADFVWLFAPGGYVGESARIEIAYARVAGIPIYSSDRELDVGLRQWVHLVASPADAVASLAPRLAPSDGLKRLQSYYRLQAEERGWAEESPQDTMLLLTEEVGELARAVRQRIHLLRDGRPVADDAAAHELADVLLLAVHLATALNIDVAEAVVEKELINRERAKLRPAS